MSNASENTTEKSHLCCNCDQSFHSSRGLKQHQWSCQSRNYGLLKYWNNRRLSILHKNVNIARWTFNTEREIHLGKVQRSWVWKELITCLWNCRVLEKKFVPVIIWGSGKKVYQRSFKINEWMATWLATEGYCV